MHIGAIPLSSDNAWICKMGENWRDWEGMGEIYEMFLDGFGMVWEDCVMRWAVCVLNGFGRFFV